MQKANRTLLMKHIPKCSAADELAVDAIGGHRQLSACTAL